MGVSCTNPSIDYYVFANVQLIKSVGRTAAVLLSKIHYWLQKDNCGVIHDNQKFIYNTAREWSEQLGVSTRQIERAVETLKERGFIKVEKLARHKAIRTNYYTINYDKVNSLYNNEKVLKMSEWNRHNVGMLNTKIPDYSSKKSNKSKSDDSQKNTATQQHDSPVKQVSEKNVEKNTTDQSQTSNTTVQQMVTIWENIFPNSQVRLTKDLSRFLYAAYKHKFNSDLKLWKHYCQTIETSSYLTSENFKLRLGWAISFKTIDRIRDGELGVKSIPVEGEKEKLEQEVIAEISEISEPDKCKQMRLTLVKRYGVHAYKAWVRDIELFEYDGKIYYKAQTDFARNYIENNFGRLIKNPPKDILEKIEQQSTRKNQEILVQERESEVVSGKSEREGEVSFAEETQAILEEISSLEEEDICKMIRSVILKLHDVETYVNLLRPANLSIENGKLRVDTFSDAHQEQIMNILDKLPFLNQENTLMSLNSRG